MRFTTASLLALSTITALFMALVWTHPATALTVASLHFALTALVNSVQQGNADARRLAGVTAMAAIGGVMIFGLATIAIWIAHSWYTSDEMRIHMAANPGFYVIYIFKFAFFYGAAAGLIGAALGTLTSIGLPYIPGRNRG